MSLQYYALWKKPTTHARNWIKDWWKNLLWRHHQKSHNRNEKKWGCAGITRVKTQAFTWVIIYFGCVEIVLGLTCMHDSSYFIKAASLSFASTSFKPSFCSVSGFGTPFCARARMRQHAHFTYLMRTRHRLHDYLTAFLTITWLLLILATNRNPSSK